VVKKKKDEEETVSASEPVTIEAMIDENELRASLEEIKSYEGVVGYILRNTTSASIDLREPAKIIDYAVLSATLFDTTDEISNIFQLGKIRNTIISGKSIKMLSLVLDGNKISVFMDNNADAEKVLKRIQKS
jgi:predicted regulator of Ras-like GTPase activity (Roadblock/LC7/MglB family)